MGKSQSIGTEQPKVLIVTHMDVPPVLGGDVRRLWGIYEWLTEKGYEVSICWVSFIANDPPQEMQEFWKDRLHVYKVYRSERSQWLRSVFTRFKCFIGLQASVDAFVDAGLSKFVAGLHATHQYSAAVAAYVFLSRSLTELPSDLVRIVDTADCFANRRKLLGLPRYPRRGFWNEATYTPAEEGRGLNRADRVLACTANDAKSFRKVVKRPVIVAAHRLPRNFQEVPSSPSGTLLFVGSSWTPNIDGMRWFLESVWPEILTASVPFRLVIVGSISAFLPETEHVSILGRVEDLADLYQKSLCVINPVSVGTGAAIKTIEALSYGRPVISVPFGFRGLEPFTPNPALINCLLPSDFKRELCRLASHPGDLDQACHGARALFDDYLRSCEAALSQAFAPVQCQVSQR